MRLLLGWGVGGQGGRGGAGGAPFGLNGFCCPVASSACAGRDGVGGAAIWLERLLRDGANGAAFWLQWLVLPKASSTWDGTALDICGSVCSLLLVLLRSSSDLIRFDFPFAEGLGPAPSCSLV
jgi:hypothetical protein